MQSHSVGPLCRYISGLRCKSITISYAGSRLRHNSSRNNKMPSAEDSYIRPDLHAYAGASNLAFNERVKGLIAEGRKIAHFGFGQAPFPVCPPLVEELKEEAGQNGYLPVAGE